MAPAMTPYSLSELRRAREDFTSRWHRALRYDQIVRYIHELHQRFPPFVRVKNCHDYPFVIENKVYEIATPCKPQDKVSTVTASAFPNFLTLNRHSAHVEDKNWQHNSTVIQLEQQNTVFICDICDFRHFNRVAAFEHLQSACHPSCSLYSSSNPIDHFDEQPEQSCTRFLYEMRVLYHGSLPSVSWLLGDIAIVCPTCYEIFPDKIMCAYHHQSHHDGLYTNYTYGSVLAARDWIVCNDFSCDQCGQKFENPDEYCDHWFHTNYICHPPFYPTPSVTADEIHLVHLVHSYCSLCRWQFCRAVPRPESDEGIQPLPFRRKRDLNQTIRENCDRIDSNHSSLTRWADEIGRFTLAHAYTHLPRQELRSTPCKLIVRVVQVNKKKLNNVPLNLRGSDRASLLLSIVECKRLLTFLVPSRSVRHALFRRTKTQLNRLLKSLALLEPVCNQ